MTPNSIYISGHDALNFPAFNAAAEDLRAQGFTVINPADHGVIEGAEWADYLRADLAQLSQCAAIYMLPGWSKSKGARLEHHVATELGMRVFFAKGAELQADDAEAELASDEEITQWGIQEQFILFVDEEEFLDIARSVLQKFGARPTQRGAPTLPEGWVPCVITYEGQRPEEIAYGPQITMDRLKKWIDRYFEMLAAPAHPLRGAPAQGVTPYAVLVFERGEEGPFDRKPVKPDSVQHLHAKRDPHYDYIELYTHPTQQGSDAAKFNHLELEIRGITKMLPEKFDCSGVWAAFEAAQAKVSK